ncbi:RNA polymerase sigma factor [Nocardioides sp.]|uniref:RNA polymerase sigma factor n=1 Tax=Nocardioides sp. TaxID=35761 RepID=UPI0035651729
MTSDDVMDEALAGLLSGDESAFRTVYRAVHPPLLRYLSVLVGPVDAEDVASEAWAQAIRDIDRFVGDADGFRAWITTIGRHRALDHLRRERRRPTVDLALLDADESLPDATDLVARVLEEESTQAAVALIAALPKDQAEAVMLRAVLGFDVGTAARILGKRPGAVRSAAHRGLKTLAGRLGQTGVLQTVMATWLCALVQTTRGAGVTPRVGAALRK